MSRKTRSHHRASSAVHANKAIQGASPAGSRENGSQDNRFHLIQIRAYQLWEQAGKPHSDATRERFWIEAEKELERPGRRQSPR